MERPRHFTPEVCLMSTRPALPRSTRRSLAAAAAAVALTAPLAAVAATVPSASAAGAGGAVASADAKVETFIRGRVVNAANGNPVAGVLVTVRDVVSLKVVAKDTTDAMGVYRVTGLTDEEYGIKLNGRRAGFETGWLACNRTVVPTWGEACSHGTGRLGPARLDRL
jgi:hypothetical protein